MEKGQGKGTDTLQTENVFTRKEYIEREEALEALSDSFTMSMALSVDECRGMRLARKIDCDVIAHIFAADVVPVRHGRWIRPTRVPDSMLDECSVCGFGTGAYTFNYCPNCGALMDKEGDAL